MEDYYRATLAWLRRGTGPAWKVYGVFAWNLVSWDVQGVHPLSFAGDGQSFRQPSVVAMIAAHNSGVNGEARRRR
jgi:hypothetical protein